MQSETRTPNHTSGNSSYSRRQNRRAICADRVKTERTWSLHGRTRRRAPSFHKPMPHARRDVMWLLVRGKPYRCRLLVCELSCLHCGPCICLYQSRLRCLLLMPWLSSFLTLHDLDFGDHCGRFSSTRDMDLSKGSCWFWRNTINLPDMIRNNRTT